MLDAGEGVFDSKGSIASLSASRNCDNPRKEKTGSVERNILIRKHVVRRASRLGPHFERPNNLSFQLTHTIALVVLAFDAAGKSTGLVRNAFD